VTASRASHWQREQQRRADLMRYHLGRGRRAREAGHFECGAAEARRALAANPRSAWALALLGQCLARQRRPDLNGARRALEQARALEPTNGYFVGLLLEVLDAQGDIRARADLLAHAWWSGAPVERWLSDGPPARRSEREPATSAADRPAMPEPDAASADRPGWAAEPAGLAGRQAVGA
jgi:hypothetical protein